MSKYFIYEKPVSVNAMHKGVKRLTPEYKDFKERAALEIAFQKPKMRRGKDISVKVTFYCKELYRGDIDNGIKSCLDACTEAGVFEDDRWITTLLVKKVKAEKDYVEIEILN